MQTASLDPFGLPCDPRGYVPRPATERALDRLEEALAAGSPLLHLYGPPGIGKTLLLQLLRERLANRFRFVYLPYPKMEPGGLWLWVGNALGIEASLDARRGMRRLAAQERDAGGALVLLVDEAEMLPPASLRDLIATAQGEAGLRVVLASLRHEDLAPALPPGTPEIRLAEPMSLEETERYVHARLSRMPGGSADLRERFDGEALAWIQRESAGVPLLVNALADAVGRGEWRNAAATPEPVASPVESHAEAVPAGSDASGGGAPLDEVRPEPQREDDEMSPFSRMRARRRGGAAPGRRASWRRPALVLAASTGLAAGLLFAFVGPRTKLVAPPSQAEQQPEAARTPLAAPPAEAAPMTAGEASDAGTLPPVDAGPPGQAPSAEATGATTGAQAADLPAKPGKLPAPLAAAPDMPEPAALATTAPPSPSSAPPAEEREPTPSPQPGSSGEKTTRAAHGTESVEATAPVDAGPPATAMPSPAATPPPVAAERSSTATQPEPAPPAPAGRPPEAASPAVASRAPAPAEPPATAPTAKPRPAAPRHPRPRGLLHVNAPQGFTVSVDGRGAGSAPIEPLSLPQGTHRVRVQQADGTVAQRTVELGEDATVTFYPPEEEKPAPGTP